MHAIRLHAFGPAANLRYEEVDDPRPGPGQVRIAVAAAGVHLIDTALREGRAMGPLALPDLPTIPGREVAGVVDAVGPQVDEQWLGRRVVAHRSAHGPGGELSFDTRLPACTTHLDAILRVRDPSSLRWSSSRRIATGCRHA